MQYPPDAYQAYERCRDYLKPRFIRCVSYIKSKFHQYRAKRKTETAQDRAARRTAIATIWIAIFTVITAGVGIKTYLAVDGQLGVMRGQLKEMDDSGKQTDKLIEANVKLADASVKQADAATNAANIAEQSMIAERRAWAGPSTATMAAPVLNEGAKITIAYSNTGNEPAPINERTFGKTFTIEDWNNGTAYSIIGSYQTECMGINDVEPTRVVYPTRGFGSGYTGFLDTSLESVNVFNRFTIDQDSIDGAKIVIVFGCLIYKSIGKVRHSSFCFFYQAKITTLPNLNICTIGNEAD